LKSLSPALPASLRLEGNLKDEKKRGVATKCRIITSKGKRIVNKNRKR
jgi:hypothetical protein